MPLLTPFAKVPDVPMSERQGVEAGVTEAEAGGDRLPAGPC